MQKCGKDLAGYILPSIKAPTNSNYIGRGVVERVLTYHCICGMLFGEEGLMKWQN